MGSETPKYLTQAYRVSHPNGDVVAGFDDENSAIQDATRRTTKATELGLTLIYAASAKP